MSVVFETIFLLAALLGFAYAVVMAHRIHLEMETDVWLWVRNTTVVAGVIPFLHLLQVVCHSGTCPVLRPILARVELLVLLVAMIFTFFTIYRLKQVVAAGTYPF